MTVAAPRPVFEPFNQAATNRVAMEIFQLFDSLLRAPNVEVIITGLPEGVPAG
jgi:hypothetical protein